MTVQDLINRLETLPRRATVVTQPYSHSYCKVYSVEQTEAILDADNEWHEHYDDVELEPGDSVRDVVVIR
jgi:hypothetical protein